MLSRDNFRCHYCGVPAVETPLTIDHVTPRALGGTDELTNLAAACGPCNIGKSATNPTPDLVAEVAERTGLDAIATTLWGEVNDRHTHVYGCDMPPCECVDYCGRPECRFAFASYMSGWMDCNEIAALTVESGVSNGIAVGSS